MNKSKYLILFTDKSFIGLWFGFFGFGLGNVIFTVALNWWVYDTTGSEVQLGIVGMLTFLPSLIFSFFSGIMVDIYNRKMIIVISLALRGVVIIFIPLLGYLNILNLWLVYVFSFLQGISFPFILNAITAIMPQFIEKENLHPANALTDAALWLSSIIGSLLGGFLIPIIGVMSIFVIGAVSTIIFSFPFLLINYTYQKSTKVMSVNNIFRDIGSGISQIYKDKVIFIMIIVWMGIIIFFGNGIQSIGWLVYSERILNTGSEGYGAIVSATSFSSLIGSLIIGHWGSKVKKQRLILTGLLWGAVGMLVLTFVSTLVPALIVVFLWNFCFPLVNIPFWTLLQDRVPEEELGKVSGAVFTLMFALNPFSTLVTGFIMETISVTLPFLLYSFAFLISAVLVFTNKEIMKLNED